MIKDRSDMNEIKSIIENNIKKEWINYKLINKIYKYQIIYFKNENNKF
jgi:hypothetical protein